MKSSLINRFKNNILECILILSIFFFWLVSLFDLKYKLSDYNVKGSKYYYLFLITSILLCVILFLLKHFTIKKLEKNIGLVFIIVTTVLGSIFIFLSPLFTGSDEHNHYYRIYEITEGILVTPAKNTVGSKMPSSLQKTFEIASGNNTKIKYSDIKKMKSVKLNEKKLKRYGDLWTNSYNNTALYSPIQYIPHTIGFLVGKSLNQGPFIIGMLGRIFNLLFYIVIGYCCLKIIPRLKLFYFLILISPNMLQCATTLSADAFTNIIFLLIISIIYNICYRKDNIKTYEKVLLFCLSIIISLCKIVYLPITLLLLIIDKNKFNKKLKGKIIFVLISLIASIIVSLLWMKNTESIFAVAYDKTSLQKNFILHNPIEYSIILVRTFSYYLVKYIECLFVGTTMYHSQLRIPTVISFSYIFIVIIVMLKDENKIKLKNSSKFLTLLISLIIIVLISTAIYMQCTAQYFSVGHKVIKGIQGRYFIPVIFLIPIVINSLKIKYNVSEKKLYLISLSVNLITFFFMLSRFIK